MYIKNDVDGRFHDETAEVEVDALPQNMQMRFAGITDLIRDLGLLAMREPYGKHLDGKLWVMRLKGEDGIARSTYLTARG